MKLKENIYQSIKTMNSDELVLLYEQIKWLERLRTLSTKPEESIPIEKIYKMTSSSKSNWANSVIEDRMERDCDDEDVFVCADKRLIKIVELEGFTAMVPAEPKPQI